MSELTPQQQAVLAELEKGPIALRALEKSPPSALSSKEARIAAQQLVDKRVLRINDHLKLEHRILQFYESHPGEWFYPLDIAMALSLDAAIVRDICDVMMASGRLVGPFVPEIMA